MASQLSQVSQLPAGKLIGVNEASKRCGVPKRTLYGWVKSGKLWSVTIGGRIMVNSDDIFLLELEQAS